MLSYKPATVKEQKIIASLNKPKLNITEQWWYISKPDLLAMALSSVGFIIILMLTL